MKLHHIGIAVDNIDSAKKIFKKVFNCTFSASSLVKDQAVKVTFSTLGNINFELIQATASSSPIYPMLPHPINNFIKKNGWGIHHIAFEVLDLEKSLENFRILGIDPLYEKPSDGADGKVNFLNPLFFNGLLIELVGK